MSFKSCVYSLVKKHEKEGFALQLKKGAEKVDKDDKKNNLGLNPRLRTWLRSTRRVYHTSTPLLNVFPLFDIRLTHCKEYTHSILLALQML